MRKVSSGLFISLDGVAQSPDQWQFDNFDEDMGAAMGQFMGETDSILLGRVTYQEWASYWPHATTDLDFADFINNMPKFVFSKTLDTVDWQNSTLVKGDLTAEVNTLKQQPGRVISVTGSPGLVRSLIENDLLDELTLMVHPVIAGHGKRLFGDNSALKRLKLVDSKATRTGVLLNKYVPRSS